MGCLLSILLFFSCQSTKSEKLTIATAANMQFAMNALVAAFGQETGIECEVIFSSSGKLTAQIKQGAPYDIFVSANMKYPNELYESSLTLGAPKIYAHGQLVLWTMEKKLNPYSILSYQI